MTRYRLKQATCERCWPSKGEIAVGEDYKILPCPDCSGTGFDGYRISEQDLEKVVYALQQHGNQDNYTGQSWPNPRFAQEALSLLIESEENEK